MALDTNFTSAINDAKTQSQLIGAYIQSSSAGSWYYSRHWMIPAKFTSFDPTAIGSLGTAFSRLALNEQYAMDAGSSSGTVGDLIADGIQLNYLGMLERAFRERHKTDVRLQMHLGGRRIAHGLTAGIHTAGVQAFVQSYLDNKTPVPN